MPSTHYVLYARRSTDAEDKQILSLESQFDELRKFAALRGIEIAEELTESASARDPGRPVFGELLRRVKAGKVEGILVWRLDRLARNMVDGGQLIYELAEGRLKEIVTPEATYTNTGDAKFMMTMLFGAAAKYTDDLSAAVKRGRSAIFARGKVPGPVPLGYSKIHYTEGARGVGTVIPDPERFDTVKRLWKEALAGTTNVSELWRKARYDWGLTTRPTKDGLAHPIALTNVYAILRNPFYAGKIQRNGEVMKGEHPPMVTLDEFRRLQELLKAKRGNVSAPPSHDFLYHGLLHCDCGRSLIGERHEKNGHVYIYYRCGRRKVGYYVCPSKAVREEDVTNHLAELLERVVVDPTMRTWAFEAIAWWAGDDEVSPEKLARRAKDALARAEQELATLTDMVVSGILTIDEYKVRRVNQLARIAHLREALASPLEKAAAWKTIREDMKENGLRLGKQFRDGDDVAKRKIVERVAAKVVVVEGRARVEWRAPFSLDVLSEARSSMPPADCAVPSKGDHATLG